MMQAKVERCYPIPNWEMLELPKPVLNRMRTKPLAWFQHKLSWGRNYFNTQRSENLDMVATYRPYHFNGSEFGLYLYVRYFTPFLLDIMERTGFAFNEAHRFALECVQAHGAFHNLVERYASLTNRISSYPRYKREIYSPLWGTKECIEETLANAYLFQNHPEWEDLKLHYVHQLFYKQRDGYAQAAWIKPSTVAFLYRELESLIGGRKNQTLEEWIKHRTPFCVEQLPVYLVNDGFEDSEFEKAIEIVFPWCV